MGRVLRKNPKNIGSVPSSFLNPSKRKRRSKAKKANILAKNKPTMHVQINNNLNENGNSSNDVTQTEVDSNAVIPNNKSIEIIDITNTTIYEDLYENSQATSSTVKNSNFENVEIIDLTNTTIISNNVNEHINSQASSNASNFMYGNGGYVDDGENNSDDDVQVIIQKTQNPIIEITISDDSDDDENITGLKSIHKPIGLKSIKERLGISNHSRSIMKKKYNSPLRSFKKQLKGETKSSDDHLSVNLGAFIIDKQRISNHTTNFKSDKFKKNVKVPALPELPNPSTVITPNVPRRLRPIAIDGLNIGHAYHAGSGTFSVKGIELCIQFFADRGHKDILVFIPHHRQGPPGSESNTMLNELVKKGQICFTPSRKVQNLRMTCYDDRIILNHAHQCGGVVVSNDNYRDLYKESEAFKDIIENRQVMVTFARGQIIVPDDQYNRKSDIRSLSDILCFPA